MRDPGGAIVALGKPSAQAESTARSLGPDVTWHSLNTVDVQRAQANYCELFGWELKPPVDIGSFGTVHPFSWGRGAPAIGAMFDIAERPDIHPHWRFYFRVEAIGPAVEAVRAGGGHALDPFTLPTGEQIALCDDPQGASFALRQGRP